MKIAILTTDNRAHHRRYELPEPYFGPAPEALFQGFARIPEAEVHVVSCTQQPMRSPEKLTGNIWFHSLRVPKIGWLRTGYQGCIRATRRKLQELQPDIVHGQGTERDSAIAAIFSGFPNVVTIHGNMGQVAKTLKARVGSFHWWTAVLERFTLRRTAGVFCNSSYTESVVRPQARRTWRVPNPVREAFFEDKSLVPDRTIPKLLNIGVVAPYKRQNELLGMAERLHQEGFRFQLQFIGAADPKTSYAAEFLHRIKAAEKAGFARYVGSRPLPELRDDLDSACALIHNSVEESFGLVVAEALSRNLKFFGVRVGGVPDIATGVEGAELFEVDDIEAMAAAIAEWMRSGCPMPATAAAEMCSRYDPKKIALRHLEIYREVCSGHSQSSH